MSGGGRGDGAGGGAPKDKSPHIISMHYETMDDPGLPCYI